MTFSLLARDQESGRLGGAAATGNLCVGAWVLRGMSGVGISASQGHYPSTLWGETVLSEMKSGIGPGQAIENTVTPDAGRASRQLIALNQAGLSGTFSGERNVPHVSEIVQQDACAAGNMLSRASVVSAAVQGYTTSSEGFLRKLLTGLEAGAQEGGDSRGLMSVALLVVSADHPPIDVRVDYSEDPLRALRDLVARIEDPDYVRWMRALPTTLAPYSN